MEIRTKDYLQLNTEQIKKNYAIEAPFIRACTLSSDSIMSEKGIKEVLRNRAQYFSYLNQILDLENQQSVDKPLTEEQIMKIKRLSCLKDGTQMALKEIQKRTGIAFQHTFMPSQSGSKR